MSFAENIARGRTSNYPRDNYAGAHRQAFHHSRTSLGATGHWIHLASVTAPLVIGELVKDPEKRWRWMRIASVAAALASEALWTHKLAKDRRKDEEAREALHACAERSI
jgi:hypothetical protein